MGIGLWMAAGMESSPFHTHHITMPPSPSYPSIVANGLVARE